MLGLESQELHPLRLHLQLLLPSPPHLSLLLPGMKRETKYLKMLPIMQM